MSGAIKLWFCAAVAMIAASIADPLMEGASNAGWFGPGNFTDHSNWDVVPVVMVGLVFVALHLCLRVRKALAGAQHFPNWLRLTADALGPSVTRLVPFIWLAQILVLYLMETTEQQVVYGHVLGGTLWLGGPAAVSLTAHAAICALVTASAARVLRAFADATVQLVQIVRALGKFPAFAAPATPLNLFDLFDLHRSVRVLCRIGERAPPVLSI